MPRITELDAYQFRVQRIHEPKRDDRGNIVHNGDGQPKLEEITMVEFIDALPVQVAPGQVGMKPLDIIRVKLPAAARDELMRQLEGGDPATSVLVAPAAALDQIRRQVPLDQ